MLMSVMLHVTCTDLECVRS